MLRAVALSVALGAAGLALVLWWLGEDLSSALRVPGWAYLAGLGIALLNYLAGSWRLQLLAKIGGKRLGFMPALRAYSLGLFSASITPGNTGQAPAMVLSLVSSAVRPAAAWAMAVQVWVSDLIFLALTLPLSVLLVARSTRLFREQSPQLVAATLLIAALFLVWVLIYRMRWLLAAASQVMRLPPLRRWREDAVEFMGRLSESGKALWRAPLRAQALVHACTAVVYLSTYVTFYVIMASLRPQVPPLTTMAAAQLPMAAASFFPTPGGAGLLEVTAATLVRGESTAAAILAWRLLTHYLRMLIGPALSTHLIASLREQFGRRKGSAKGPGGAHNG